MSVVKVVNSPYLYNKDIKKNIDYLKENKINVLEYGYLNRANNIGEDNERNPKLTPKGCELNRHNERIYIYHNGDCFFCCHDWGKKYLLGNINETSIKEIWESERYQKIRDMVNGKSISNDDFICRHCKLCYGG